MDSKIDLTRLQLLLGGDDKMVSRFLELFKTEMPKQLSALQEQLQAGDFAAANITAHGLKGQLRTLGLEALADLAFEIEYKTETPSATTGLSEDFTSLKAQLEALF